MSDVIPESSPVPAQEQPRPAPRRAPPVEKRPAPAVSSVQIMFAAIIAIVLILAINFSNRIADGQPLQQTYDEVNAEIVRLREEQVELIAQRDYVRSDAYVEQWARSEGKMVRDGEILVIPVPSSSAADLPQVEPLQVEVQTTDPQPDPWEVWWQLFFDATPPEF
jgi:cell division protein FtsB